MTDITSTHLDAALIDQIVAGAFPDKPYAFVAVVIKTDEWQLGVAVANESGYNPIAKTFATWTEAKKWADALNAHIGRDEDSVLAIIASTMGGRSVIELID